MRPASVLTSVLSKIDEPEKPSASQSSHIANSNIPRPLRRYVPNNYADLHWQKVLQNIYEYRIPIEDQRYTAKFYRISAGKELPEHTHRGKEYTFVMEGSFSDRTSHYYEGDFIIADDQVVHKPHASEDSDCICFAVTDAPLKMTGYFSRVINPFLK